MVVHPDSGRISRVRPYSGTLYRSFPFRLRGSHPLWPPVPGTFFYGKKHRILRSYNPTYKYAVWAVPRSLATTRGISFLISFPRLLRCFSSPSLPPGPTSIFVEAESSKIQDSSSKKLFLVLGACYLKLFSHKCRSGTRS